MPSVKRVALFGEDEGHVAVIQAILYKLCPGCRLEYVTINRKNHVLRTLIRSSTADILVLVKDANAEGFSKRHRYLLDLVPQEKHARLVICVPDPYIEKWLLLDSAAFKRVFGKGFDAPKSSETRGYYKDLLRRSIVESGHTTKTGLERAADIINAMDFDTIQDDSFKTFIEELNLFL